MLPGIFGGTPCLLKKFDILPNYHFASLTSYLSKPDTRTIHEYDTFTYGSTKYTPN